MMTSKFIDHYPITSVALALGCGYALGLAVSTYSAVRFIAYYALKKT